jgi:hypothetical protein
MAKDPDQDDRVAILLIHGIGEQRPMGTLKSFVESLLSTRDEKDRDLYSRPDSVSGSYELRSYATRSTKEQPKLHFFEFYWAHHMASSTLGHMMVWISQIFLRWPWSVPARNLLPWLVVWAAALAIGTAVYLLSTAEVSGWALMGIAALAALALRRIAETAFTDWIGDAARYLSATPKNVAVRQAIRAAGIELLEKLHRDERYDRIIVVGHSLGSVIAVDILHHFWYRARVQGKLENATVQSAFDALES